MPKTKWLLISDKVYKIDVQVEGVPSLYVHPTSHDFGTMDEGQTASWDFYIENTGGGTLEWDTSESLSWVVDINPPSDSATTETDTVTVDIDTTGLTRGEHYDGYITVSSNDGTDQVYVEVDVGEFTGTDFLCACIEGGHECSMSYTNNLGEGAVVVFIYANSTTGLVVDHSVTSVPQGSGMTSSQFSCDSVDPGTYQASWTAYRESDPTLSDRVAWCKSYEVQHIECPACPPDFSIMLVDDDSGDNYEQYYQDAFAANGYSFYYWNVASQGSPPLLALQSYSIVVWFTGNDPTTTLTDTDQANLQAYLDGGGNLLISGQDIGYNLTVNGFMTNAFFTDYLHGSYVQDDVNLYDLNGVSGDPISDGLYLTISGGDGANNQNWPSEIDPLPPAVSVFRYGLLFAPPSATSSEAIQKGEKAEPKESRKVGIQGISSSGSGAIRACTEMYKVVYFAFGFEAINSATDRNTVMDRVIGWLSSYCRHPDCFGDFDCDCEVKVQDIQQVASRWRMTEADDDWNPWYDLDNDGIITVVDIMLLVAHWGETCG